jgi:hypothetical protein
MQAKCSCCFLKEHQSGCKRISNAEQLPPGSKNHQAENNCHEEENKCSCIKCGISDNNEALFSKTHFTGLEKNNFLVLEKNILEKSLLLKEDKVIYLGSNTPLKFLSLLLIKSSFLF